MKVLPVLAYLETRKIDWTQRNMTIKGPTTMTHIFQLAPTPKSKNSKIVPPTGDLIFERQACGGHSRLNYYKDLINTDTVMGWGIFQQANAKKIFLD